MHCIQECTTRNTANVWSTFSTYHELWLSIRIQSCPCKVYVLKTHPEKRFPCAVQVFERVGDTWLLLVHVRLLWRLARLLLSSQIPEHQGALVRDTRRENLSQSCVSSIRLFFKAEDEEICSCSLINENGLICVMCYNTELEVRFYSHTLITS